MDINLSIDRICSLYRGLLKEAYGYFGLHDAPFVPLEIRPPNWYESRLGFSPMAGTYNRRGVKGQVTATSVYMDEKYIPYLYEDEVICILLHEIAHVVTPYDHEATGHGIDWQMAAEELGCLPSPVLTPRLQSEFPWIPEEERLWLVGDKAHMLTNPI